MSCNTQLTFNQNLFECCKQVISVNNWVENVN